MPLPFVQAEWIGVGKQYIVENLPEYVSDAKEALLKIPRSFEATYIPQDELVVNQFIKKDIPTQSAELWPIKAADCFSPNNPTIAWDMLARRTVPSSQILTTLESALGQAWFDGAKSVIDWRYNDGQEYLPFWVIQYWRRISVVSRKQMTWSRAVNWIEKNLRSSKPHEEKMENALEKVFPIFDHLPWNTPLPYLRRNVTTADLAPFLGTNWLNDDHINMMVEDINHRISLNKNLRGKILVAPLVFATNIQLNRGSKYLDRIVQMVASKELEKLYFPVNINENHWITAYVDFTAHSFGYGRIGRGQWLKSIDYTYRRLIVKSV